MEAKSVRGPPRTSAYALWRCRARARGALRVEMTVAHVFAESPGQKRGNQFPPRPLPAGGTIPYRLEFEIRLDFSVKGRRHRSAW